MSPEKTCAACTYQPTAPGLLVPECMSCMESAPYANFKPKVLNAVTPMTAHEFVMTRVDTMRKEARADDIQVGGSHYKDMPMQPWEVMESLMTREEFIGFLKGNMLKYAMRAGKKPGSDDEGKAKHYRDKLQEVQAKA